MEIKDIYGLWDRFDASGAAEMELDFYGVHFHLKKDGSGSEEQKQDPAEQPVQSKEKRVDLTENPLMQTDSVGEKKKVPAPNRVAVKAPLVGIFYHAPAPGAEPFVHIGQAVKKGDVIGIIEAMKCMNEIAAQEDGIVDEILAEDASMVEYDQVLLTLRPSGEEHV